MRIITTFFIAILFISFSYGQEEEKETNDHPDWYKSSVNIGGMGAEGAGIYAMAEFFMTPDDGEPLSFANNGSLYARIQQTFESHTVFDGFKAYEIKTTGLGVEIGTRSYYSKTKQGRGFFTGNSLKYFSIKYDDSRFSGTYSYFSFFAPELGYKFGFGKSKRLNLELFAGTEWVIEVKGKGDIDNKNYDNWKFKAGVGIGYAF